MPGYCVLSAPIANAPDGAMPILPVAKAAKKLAPVSVCAPAGTSPFVTMPRYSASAARSCGESSVALAPSPVRMSPPDAHTIGITVKMLQPAQLPEK